MLLELPNELLLQIAADLQAERDIAAFTRTNKRIYDLTVAYLYHVNASDSKSSALLWAATYGSLTTASRALKEISNDDDDDDDDDKAESKYIVNVALVAAAGANQVDMAEFLVENGANRHAYDAERRRNAMEAAAEKGHTDIVKLLLSLGANPRAGAGSHRFAIQWAALGGHIDIVRLLIEAGEDPDRCSGRPGGGSHSPLQTAAMNDNVELAKLLLSKGARVDHRSSSKETPLELAVMRKSLRCVKVLLENGAKVYDKSARYGRPPVLENARHPRFGEFLELLQNEPVHVYSRE